MVGLSFGAGVRSVYRGDDVRVPQGRPTIRQPPPFPEGHPVIFRSTVHGTVFGDRARCLEELVEGDTLRLQADPPGVDEPEVWVHLTSGDPIGHLPPEINVWLCPWIRAGGIADAVAQRVRGEDTPSWRRVVVQVTCRTGSDSA